MNAHWIENGLHCACEFYTSTHATRGTTPLCQPRQLARCQKSEDVKRFSIGRPQRAKPENWQGVAKSSEHCPLTGRYSVYSCLEGCHLAVSHAPQHLLTEVRTSRARAVPVLLKSSFTPPIPVA